MQPQGLGDGNVRLPGKSGFAFDHISSRLQGELPLATTSTKYARSKSCLQSMMLFSA
jgi:hypothetical protein